MEKPIRQMGIIMLACLAGELASRLIGGYIPGNVIGMALLFALLCLGVVRLEQVEGAADFLISNITLFLIPATVGLISAFDAIRDNFLLFIVVCVVTTAAVLVITGQSVRFIRFLMRRRAGENKAKAGDNA